MTDAEGLLSVHQFLKYAAFTGRDVAQASVKPLIACFCIDN
jgi:hypothetical protein